jgi:hypothetical protein
MAAHPIMIDSAKGPWFLPMGVRVTIPLGYDIGQLATGLWREAVVHVCLRDFPRDAMVFLGVACRALDRGRRLFVFARTAEAPSRQAASEVSMRLSGTRRSWSLSDNLAQEPPYQ